MKQNIVLTTTGTCVIVFFIIILGCSKTPSTYQIASKSQMLILSSEEVLLDNSSRKMPYSKTVYSVAKIYNPKKESFRIVYLDNQNNITSYSKIEGDETVFRQINFGKKSNLLQKIVDSKSSNDWISL